MKKRLISMLLVSSMMIGASSTAAFGDFGEKNIKEGNAINLLKEKTQDKEKFEIHWDSKTKVPDFIKGNLSENGVTSESGAVSFLQKNKALFNLESESFKVKKVVRDELGKTHYRTQIMLDGIPVYGGDLIVHTDSNGQVYAVNGKVKQGIEKADWNSKIRLSKDEAIKVAEKSVPEKAVEYLKEPSAIKYIYEFKNKAHVVYLVELQYINPVWAKWNVFVDAETGNVVDMYNGVTFAEQAAVGTGLTGFGQQVQINTVNRNGVFYLEDTTKDMSGRIKTYDMENRAYIYAPGTIVSDSDNNFNSNNQKAAVSAHYYIGKVYDYYKAEYNRNSYDNNGSDIISNVHCAGRNGEINWNNAAWIGDQFVYGDGDGVTFKNLSDAFDVVAHEFTHGVTDTSSDLEYRFQSGALNEAISDIIGVAVENEAGDWLVGEDCYTPNIAGDALRSMKDPTLYNQPGHMDNFQNHPISYDNGGVHINSGIINKAAYNIGNVVGIYKMGQIFYRANNVYYTATTDFAGARTGAVQAAEDIYGATSTEKQAVIDGFTAVGIGGTSGGNGPFEENDSFDTAHGSIVSGETLEAYLENSTDYDYYYFDAKSAGDVTITLKNLAGDYDLYLYNSSKTEVAKSTKSATSNETINYSAPGAGKFYIKVIGYKGVYSTTKAYQLTATYPSAVATETWKYVDNVIESSHNYSNNSNTTEIYSKAGASKVAVHFVKLETEKGYDFVYIKDADNNKIKTYDGSLTDFWAIIDGDTLKINLVSDYSINKYGYKIDRVGYYDASTLTSDMKIMNLQNEGITDETTEIESTFDPNNRPEKRVEYKDNEKGKGGPINRPGNKNEL